MSGLDEGKTMTTGEIARALGVSARTVQRAARRCLPGKEIEGRKPTLYTGEEAAALTGFIRGGAKTTAGETDCDATVEFNSTVASQVTNLITTQEIAARLNTTRDLILAAAERCLPGKAIEHGVATYWSEQEATVILDYLKNHVSNNRSSEFNSAVASAETRLTPALKIKRAFDLMREGYEEELAALRAENEAMRPRARAYMDYVDRGGFCNFRDGARYLGIREGTLMAFLRERHIYRNAAGEYRCYAEYGRYFALRPYIKCGGGTGQQLMLTIEGLEYLGRRLGGRT